MRPLRCLVLGGLAFIGPVLLASCSKVPDEAKPATKAGDGRVEWIDPKAVQPGPVRHERLSEEQLARIRKLREVFSEVDGQTLEQWVDNFKRDLDPDRELRVWERMATAYEAFCRKRKLSAEGKKDAYRVVLLHSMTDRQHEILDRVKLNELSKEDAAELIRDY